MTKLNKKEKILELARANREKKKNETFEKKNSLKTYKITFNKNIMDELHFVGGDD